MSSTRDFLYALKQAAIDYQANTLVPFQVSGLFGYRSLGSRLLVNELSQLNPDDANSLESAVKAIVTYIHRVGTSNNPTRGFWVKKLKPCLEKFAKNPLTDVSDEDKTTFLDLELEQHPCSQQIIKQRDLLFNVLGTEKKLSDRYKLTNDAGINNASNGLDSLYISQANSLTSSSPGPGRFVCAALTCNESGIPGPIAPFATDIASQQSLFNQYQANILLCMLDKIEHDELLIALKRIKTKHVNFTQGIRITDSFLYKIADRQQAHNALAPPTQMSLEWPATREAREAQLNNLTQDCIDCFKEIQRIKPGVMFEHDLYKLYAIVTGEPEYFFPKKQKSNADIAYAIADRPLWKNELMNPESTIYIDKIMNKKDAEEILLAIELKPQQGNGRVM